MYHYISSVYNPKATLLVDYHLHHRLIDELRRAAWEAKENHRTSIDYRGAERLPICLRWYSNRFSSQMQSYWCFAESHAHRRSRNLPFGGSSVGQRPAEAFCVRRACKPSTRCQSKRRLRSRHARRCCYKGGNVLM